MRRNSNDKVYNVEFCSQYKLEISVEIYEQFCIRFDLDAFKDKLARKQHFDVTMTFFSTDKIKIQTELIYTV